MSRDSQNKIMTLWLVLVITLATIGYAAPVMTGAGQAANEAETTAGNQSADTYNNSTGQETDNTQDNLTNSTSQPDQTENESSGDSRSSQNSSDGPKYVNTSQVDVIIEVGEDGNKVMISIQGMRKVNRSRVTGLGVSGAELDEPLSVDDKYPMAIGNISRPTEIKVTISLSNGEEYDIASRSYQ